MSGSIHTNIHIQPIIVLLYSRIGTSFESPMDHKKGQSNDTDSRASNASSTRDQESTEFSDDPLSSSAFTHARLDAQLDLDHAELDQPTLWTHTQRHSCLRPPHVYQRLVVQQQYTQDMNDGTNTTASFNLPLENHVFNPWFQFPVPGSVPPATSPRVMSSKLLDMHHGFAQSSSSSSSSSSGSGTHVDSEVSPPAGKKMRSMWAPPPVGKHEHPFLEPTHSSMDRQPWMSCEGGQVSSTVMGARSTVMGTRELNTMEQLLVQCATALEASDITNAQQTIFVMNNIASLDGDPNQRLLAHFLRALLLKYAPHLMQCERGLLTRTSKVQTILELTNYIDVMPWYRFGFIAANGAILEAFEGKAKVHILDFNVTHCMQWPTLIEALAERSEGPPHVRLTVCVSGASIPPLVEVPYDVLVMRLAKFARSKNVPFEYELLAEDRLETLDMSRIGIRDGEALAVNCLFRLHYVSDESGTQSGNSPRDEVLRFIRTMNPAVVTLTEEDANLTSPKLVPRMRAAFNYLWIPFDALHTLLPGDSLQRRRCEEEVGDRIENLVACDGGYRMERVETKDRWVQRMRRARFDMVGFSEDVVAENRLMLGEHSGCWGIRKDEDEDVLILTWKGHNVSFTTAWVPVDQVNL